MNEAEQQGYAEQRLALKQKILSEQSLTNAIVVGVMASVFAAIAWASIVIGTGFQVSWIAVGIGFIVGKSVWLAGRGVREVFGIIGSGCAGFSIVLGQYLVVVYIVSEMKDLSIMTVIFSLNPIEIIGKIIGSWSIFDMLFVVCALGAGFICSYKSVVAYMNEYKATD